MVIRKKYLKYLIIGFAFLVILLLFASLVRVEESLQVGYLDDKTSVSLDEFNEMFGSSMVSLPKNIVAVGYSDGQMVIHTSADKIDRDTFIIYFNDEILPNIKKSKFYYLLCFTDGYLERNAISASTISPYYPTKYEFLDKEEVILDDPSKYPILHSKEYIFAFCRKKDFQNTVLVPDDHYIRSNRYHENFKKVDDNWMNFEEKKDLCVWRGTLINGTSENFIEPDGKNKMNQREYFADLYNKNTFRNMDYSETHMGIEDMMKYKYILSIDGWSNQWSAVAWGLYSGSVLLKTESVWEQWFYKDLIEWVHYVPVNNDFSDLNEKIEWCMNNGDKCKEIVKNARSFAIQTYDWNNVKKYTIETFNKYV